jgi:hypothetical protein
MVLLPRSDDLAALSFQLQGNNKCYIVISATEDAHQGMVKRAVVSPYEVS